MADFKDEIIEASEVCSSCGACQAVCPVYRSTRREETSARAKIRLAGALAKGQIKNSSAVAKMLSACLLCGRCSQACPNQVDARKAQEQARRLGPVTLKAKALDGVVGQPGKLDAVMRASRIVMPGDSGMLLRLSNLKGLNKLPRPAEQFFLQNTPQVISGPAGAPKVALFVGCLANYLRPELAQKAVEILARRFTVIVPPEQGCCGLMARSSGAVETSARLNLRNEKALVASGVDMIITVCSSCAYALQALDLPPVREICQVLVHDFAGLTTVTGETVSLHTPCHQGVGLGAADDPEKLLESARVKMIGEPGIDQCCGGGGLFAPDNPELSDSIFAPILREMVRGGADILATTCSGCFIQWRRGLPSSKKVCHPLDLIY